MVHDLVLYWRFAEFKDSVVIDASGNGNSGSIQSGGTISKTPLTPGNPISDENDWGEKVEPGRSLHGTVVCNEISHIDRDFTIEFYFRRTQRISEAANELVSFGEKARVELKSDFSSIFVFEDEYPTLKRILLNRWTHFALTSSENKLSCFIDGECVLSSMDLLNLPSRCLKIGDSLGDITEVRVWSVQRSREEILQYMQSPLPRSTPVSKWKGLRIKDSSSHDKQVPVVPVVIPNQPRTRRVTTPVSQVVFPDACIATEKARPASVLFTGPSVRTGVTPDDAGANVTDGTIESSGPNTEPPRSQASAVRRGSWIPPTLNLVQHAGETISVPTSPLPNFESEQTTTQIVGSPVPVPTNLPEAICFFDNFLNRVVHSSVSVKPLIASMSQYINTHYRFGPFIAPYPEESLMARLGIACKYLAVENIVKNGGPIHLVLRVPILKQDVIKYTMRAIDLAVGEQNSVDVNFYVKTLIKSCGSDMQPNEIERIRAIDTSHFKNAEKYALCCPLCSCPFDTPLQEYCYNGCRTRFTVCFLTGKWLDSTDCLKCVFCESTIGMASKRRDARGLSVANLNQLDAMCPICQCSKKFVRI